MRWFRSNGVRIAWLAYFALACQFVLTFGHVHLSGAGLVPYAVAITADAAGGTAPSSSPTRKAPAGPSRDVCAVCNNLNLAKALVLPIPPLSIPPTSFVQQMQWPPEAIKLLPRDHLYFDARGPPHA
jgi:hypothetical protein